MLEPLVNTTQSFTLQLDGFLDHSLKGEPAAMLLLGILELDFLFRRTADQEKLVLGFHRFQELWKGRGTEMGVVLSGWGLTLACGNRTT